MRVERTTSRRDARQETDDDKVRYVRCWPFNSHHGIGSTYGQYSSRPRLAMPRTVFYKMLSSRSFSMLYPSHRSAVVAEKKQELCLRTLRWPSRSPDMNPIEHMWSFINGAPDSSTNSSSCKCSTASKSHSSGLEENASTTSASTDFIDVTKS